MAADEGSRIYEKLDADRMDVIGDIHGCFSELAGLLEKLGYEVGEDGWSGMAEGRTQYSWRLHGQGPNP